MVDVWDTLLCKIQNIHGWCMWHIVVYVIIIIINKLTIYIAPYAQTNWKQGRFHKGKSYESRNKWVFSLDLNMPTVSATLTESGILFQIVGPATAKDRWPNLVLVRGMTSVSREADRRAIRVWTGDDRAQEREM